MSTIRARAAAFDLRLRFALLATAWSVVLFGLLRQPWIDGVVVPLLVRFQRTLAIWYGAQPSGAVQVTSACSGTDVVALCTATILAYPVAWRRRLIGIAGGLVIILAVNIIRIATLIGLTPASAWFNLLHVYVWPLVLIVAVLLYVLAWSQLTGPGRPAHLQHPSLTFGGALIVFLILEAAIAPWAMTSQLMLQASDWAAQSGRALLTFAGVHTSGTGRLLAVRGLTVEVTPECLLSPTLAVYLAALVAVPLTQGRRLAGAVAVIPLFFALGVARLLMVAIPPSIVGSPLVAVHSFFQFLAGFAAIAASAIVVRHQDDRERTGVSFRVLLGSVAAIGVAAVLGGGWDVFVSSSVRLFQGVAPHVLGDGGRAADVQGALGLLPRYQLGLLVGIWLATGTRVNGLGPLRALLWLWGSQLLLLVGVGELTAHLGVSAHAIFIRGWAVAVPIGVYLLLNVRRVDARDREYRDWWTRVGREFPVLTGAPSTDLYFANEVRLLSEQIPDFQHCRFLKSDLWDEAKNTRILQWVAARGARAYGIDISAPIVNSARDAFEGTALAAAIADVRGIPFADNAFDIVYSMGTVEHFAESEAAVREMARVLKPDGRLILGVPNRHDFFLRPALVAVLNRLGCYAYGFEKSYSRRELRGMLERAGLDVVAESGILFIPGWLRMLDLACYTTWRPLARVTAPAVAVFAWIDRRFPRVRRHGYLLASTGVKREGRDQP